MISDSAVIFASKGDVSALREVTTRQNVNYTDDLDRTSLYHAAHKGHVECVRFLLDMGADWSIADVMRFTALDCAAGCQEETAYDCFRLFVDAGALSSVNSDKPGLHEQLLYLAIQSNNRKIAHLLIDMGERVSCLRLWRCPPGAPLPVWVTDFVEGRSLCRRVAIAFIDVHKYILNRLSRMDINVMIMISKHIWSSRMSAGWNGNGKEC
jgi:hypothetical protein